jgi:hypothetical protein
MNWPLVWLQAPGSIEILRKLLPGEIVPASKILQSELSFPSIELFGRICNSVIALDAKRVPANPAILKSTGNSWRRVWEKATNRDEVNTVPN